MQFRPLGTHALIKRLTPEASLFLRARDARLSLRGQKTRVDGELLAQGQEKTDSRLSSSDHHTEGATGVQNGRHTQGCNCTDLRNRVNPVPYLLSLRSVSMVD